jgi:hypothetical protein
MTLLVDTDIFCKLGLAELLKPSAELLGSSLESCARLPALTYMLRKGSLFQRLGRQACQKLAPMAESMRSIPQPSENWLDKLARIDAIDPGEAVLLAASADFGLIALTGDKRALRAVKEVDGLPEILKGRIVTLETILHALCVDLGVHEVRRRVSPIVSLDTMLSVCFSEGNTSPVDCLQSYHRSLASEVAPLTLWGIPESRGG